MSESKESRMNGVKASIRCGNCRQMHGSVGEVKACYGSVVPPAAPQPKVEEKAQPEFVTNPASERQYKFAQDLLNAREWSGLEDGRLSELAMDVCDGKALGKSEASRLIDALLACPYVARSKDDGAWPNIPEGKYALDTDDGVKFYQVDKPAEGKWAGYIFVKLLVGAPGNWAEYRQKGQSATTVLEGIDRMGARESAALFGFKSRTCGRCSSPLSTKQSRAAGYGETCAEKLGWPYPSKREAERILNERGESVDE